ncbi:MAG: TIGR00730 family Rossman fold protein [Eubacterium sp.]|nr:TIGR00730 family Rossman fold protein [Eubacterium sp.]
MKICIFGAASNRIDKVYIESVESFSKELAQRGHSLVFGAGKDGVMGAAARGFTEGKGKLYGVIPKFFNDFDIEVKYDKCTELIFTENMRERKAKMEELADAFLIAPGGIGTFEEFFEVLTLKQLGRHSKPIAVYNVNGYYDEMYTMLDMTIKQGFLNEECRDIFFMSDDREKLVYYLENEHDTPYTIYDLKK